MKVLECHSKGDKRFSALYAQVTIEGKKVTIEKFYQNAKKLKDGTIASKGKDFHHLEIFDKLRNQWQPFHLRVYNRHYDKDHCLKNNIVDEYI